MPQITGQLHLSDGGLFSPFYWGRNSMLPRFCTPIRPRCPGIFPAIGGGRARNARSSVSRRELETLREDRVSRTKIKSTDRKRLMTPVSPLQSAEISPASGSPSGRSRWLLKEIHDQMGTEPLFAPTIGAERDPQAEKKSKDVQRNLGFTSKSVCSIKLHLGLPSPDM
jgi:hypothetical protein